MSAITTRAGKGSPLTNNEIDANFNNLNNDKVEKSGSVLTGALQFTAIAANTEETVPAAGLGKLYAKNIADRVMPKWVGPSGVDYSLQAHEAFNRIGVVRPNNAAVLTSYNLNMVVVGTVSTPALAATNLRAQTKRATNTSVATAAGFSSFYASATECWRGNAVGLGGFFHVQRFGLSVLAAGMRAFAGLTDIIAAPTNIDPTTSTTPGKVGMAINANTGNWNLVYNVTGSAPTVVALGASFPVDATSLFELILFAAPNSASISYRVANLTTNAVASGNLTTNIPASATFLAPSLWATNNATAASVAIDLVDIYLETDY